MEDRPQEDLDVDPNLDSASSLRDQLSDLKASVLGVVLNGTEPPKFDHGYYGTAGEAEGVLRKDRLSL